MSTVLDPGMDSSMPQWKNTILKIDGYITLEEVSVIYIILDPDMGSLIQQGTTYLGKTRVSIPTMQMKSWAINDVE